MGSVSRTSGLASDTQFLRYIAVSGYVAGGAGTYLTGKSLRDSWVNPELDCSASFGWWPGVVAILPWASLISPFTHYVALESAVKVGWGLMLRDPER